MVFVNSCVLGLWGLMLGKEDRLFLKLRLVGFKYVLKEKLVRNI